MVAVRLSQVFAWIEVKAGSWVGFVMASCLVAACFLCCSCLRLPLCLSACLVVWAMLESQQAGRPLLSFWPAKQQNGIQRKPREGGAHSTVARSLTFPLPPPSVAVALATTTPAKCPLLRGIFGQRQARSQAARLVACPHFPS